MGSADESAGVNLRAKRPQTENIVKSHHVEVVQYLDFMRKENVSTNNKRILPASMSNEIQLPDNRERIYYSPIISRNQHPWLYIFIRWTSGPLSLAASTFNLILKYLLFWKNEEKTQEILDMYESDLMEILTSNLFLPNYESGSVSFFLGTFEEAVAQAKHDYKMLLVYLHRLGNSEADDFLCFSFLNSNVVTLLNDPENILIWTGHLSNSEGQEVSCIFNIPEGNSNAFQYFFNPLTKLFECPTIPFLFSLLTITSLNGSIKLSVVGQLEKRVSESELTNILKKWIEIGTRPRLIAKRERISRNINETLKKDQEKAFNEMLERDKMKEHILQSEIEKSKVILEIKKELYKKLKEMEKDLNEEISSSIKTISLLVKMQNGRRFNWKFPLNKSVKYLYYLVYSQEDSPENFELLWNYPQVAINCFINKPLSSNITFKSQENDPLSFEELGIVKNEIILVRDLDK